MAKIKLAMVLLPEELGPITHKHCPAFKSKLIFFSAGESALGYRKVTCENPMAPTIYCGVFFHCRSVGNSDGNFMSSLICFELNLSCINLGSMVLMERMGVSTRQMINIAPTNAPTCN